MRGFHAQAAVAALMGTVVVAFLVTALAATPAVAAPKLSPYATSIFQLEPDNPSVGGFDDPEGVATSPAGDAVYVVDAAQARVVEMTPYGTYVRSFGCCGTAQGKLVRPTGIATDSQGHVWVADNGQGILDEYRATGGFLRSFSIPFVFGVAISPDAKTIYAATHFFNLVAVLGNNGKQLGAFAPCPASQNNEFLVTCALRGIATGPDASVYLLTNTQIHYSELCNPGSNYGTDSPPVAGWEEVDRFAPGGTLQTGTWGVKDGPDDCYHGFGTNDYFTGVAIDPGSSYSFATYASDDQVLSASPANTNFGSLDRPPYPSYTNIPTGWFTALAFDCQSNLYVTAYDTGSVIKYDNLDADPTDCSPFHRLALASARIGGIFRVGNKLSIQIGCARRCKGTLSLYSGHKLLGHKTVLLRAGKTRQILVRPDATLHVEEAIRAVFKPHGLRVARLRTHVLAISTLTFRAPSSVESGHLLAVSGNVTPAHRGRRVRVLVVGGETQTFSRLTTTDAAGHYVVKLMLPARGVWTLRADLEASARAQPAVTTSRYVKVLPLPVPTRPLTRSAPPDLRCPAALQPGQNLSLEVHGPAFAPLRLTVTIPGHAPVVRTVALGSDGAFDNTFLAGTPGTWRVTARLIEGTSTSCVIRVRSQETLMLTCPTNVPLPRGSGTADLSGTTAPPVPRAGISLHVTGGGGARTVLARADANGSYDARVPLTMSDVGDVSATASFAGDATHGPATSSTCHFSVG